MNTYNIIITIAITVKIILLLFSFNNFVINLIELLILDLLFYNLKSFKFNGSARLFKKIQLFNKILLIFFVYHSPN